MRAKEFITELFDQPVEYDLFPIQIDRNKLFIKGLFIIDNIHYIVEIDGRIRRALTGRYDELFDQYGINAESIIADISFAIKADHLSLNYYISNTGNQYKVFSTVIKIIEDVCQQHKNIKVITFDANNEKSRYKLYKRMARYFSDRTEWTLANVPGDENAFYLVRK